MIINVNDVKQAITRKELSQKQVANMAKIAPSTLSNWLAGRIEPSEITQARVAMVLDLIEPGELNDMVISKAMSPTDNAAAAEILDAIAPAQKPAPDPEPEPEPAPLAADANVPDKPTAAELVYLLTRLPGCYLYQERDGDYSVALPRGGELERFARNLQALDAMRISDDIDADAHLIATASLLGAYKRREAEENG